MDKAEGSMETLSTMQITADMEGLDAQSKAVLRSREVLAVILQGTAVEYKGYSLKDIMGFIEPETLDSGKEVSVGRTNTQVRGDSAEFAWLNEKLSYFDIVFRARNPVLSEESVQVDLHIDLEPQRSYRPGYPIEKRGIYYLSRLLSAQLSLVTEQTDYGQLEKCYSIWICLEDIPKKARNSVSFYEIANTRNIGGNTAEKEDYDLMTLVVIKLGDKAYRGKSGDEGYDLLRFLNAIMYPHRDGFMDTVSDYIDFSVNRELWKEVTDMGGLGQSILEEGREEGREEGIFQTLSSLVADGVLKLEEAAGRMGLSETAFWERMKEQRI